MRSCKSKRIPCLWLLLSAAACERSAALPTAVPATVGDATAIVAAGNGPVLPVRDGGAAELARDDDADGGFALDCPHGGKVSVVHVAFHCGAITTYTCKDLSNVVLEFEDGTRQRFEDQSGHVNTFTGTGANAGKRVVRVWVKAGPNFSGDGPGYGERVEAPDETCQPPAAGGGGAGGTGEPCTPGPDGACAPPGNTGGVGGTGEPCIVTPDGSCAPPGNVAGHGVAGEAGSNSPD
jgi:hypothetical protein